MKIVRIVFFVALFTSALLLASCAAPTPEVIEVVVTEEVVVEKEVIVTQEVEVEKEVVVTQEVEKEVIVEVQGAIPYPEGVPMAGGEVAQKFALDEMIVYKALDSYSQPEWMDALVEDGTLPPVEERLPVEPQVFLESGMADGLGAGDNTRGTLMTRGMIELARLGIALGGQRPDVPPAAGGGGLADEKARPRLKTNCHARFHG